MRLSALYGFKPGFATLSDGARVNDGEGQKNLSDGAAGVFDNAGSAMSLG